MNKWSKFLDFLEGLQDALLTVFLLVGVLVVVSIGVTLVFSYATGGGVCG